ncbi:unnamed protein product, partial [Prorocentrum cordatum]
VRWQPAAHAAARARAGVLGRRPRRLGRGGVRRRRVGWEGLLQAQQEERWQGRWQGGGEATRQQGQEPGQGQGRRFRDVSATLDQRGPGVPQAPSHRRGKNDTAVQADSSDRRCTPRAALSALTLALGACQRGGPATILDIRADL